MTKIKMKNQAKVQGEVVSGHTSPCQRCGNFASRAFTGVDHQRARGAWVSMLVLMLVLVLVTSDCDAAAAADNKNLLLTLYC
jgi:hypothetical protein